MVLLKETAGLFVDGSAGLARKLNVSELATGLTVVAFGTFVPELVVNSLDSIRDNDDIVVGNVIGSNCFILFVILSISGLITPLRVKSSTAWREIPFSFIAIAVIYLVANDSMILSRKGSFNSRIG